MQARPQLPGHQHRLQHPSKAMIVSGRTNRPQDRHLAAPLVQDQKRWAGSHAQKGGCAPPCRDCNQRCFRNSLQCPTLCKASAGQGRPAGVPANRCDLRLEGKYLKADFTRSWPGVIAAGFQVHLPVSSAMSTCPGTCAPPASQREWPQSPSRLTITVAVHPAFRFLAGCPRAKRAWLFRWRRGQPGEHDRGSSDRISRVAATNLPHTGIERSSRPRSRRQNSKKSSHPRYL